MEYTAERAGTAASNNEEAGPTFGEISDLTDEEEADEEHRDRPITVEEAEAELASLEGGRATPNLRHNFKPPRSLEQIVHTRTERQRELRVSALKAYLDFVDSRPELAAKHDVDNSLEPSL